MNFIEPNQPLSQPIKVTPRAHNAGVYSLRWTAEGTTTEINIPAVLVAQEGSFLTIEAITPAKEKAVYWFKVMVGNDEIYRGKAIAVNPTNPLIYSMY